jgi:RNA polymerase-binding transcription factor
LKKKVTKTMPTTKKKVTAQAAPRRAAATPAAPRPVAAAPAAPRPAAAAPVAPVAPRPAPAPAKPNARRKKFLAKVVENLGEMKIKLLSEMESELKAEREGNKDEGMDTYDLASEERDREISFILADRERVKIKQIDDALERLADGSYGICESCGLDIGEERLEVMPFTRLCRDCQQDQEREARSQRRYDDERNVYRKLGSTDNEEESG